MDKRDKRSVRSSKPALLKVKRRKLKEGETIDQLTEARRTYKSADGEIVKDKRDKISVRSSKPALIKVKRRKLKEGETIDQLTEARRTSKSADGEIMKEETPIKTDKEKNDPNLALKKKRKKGITKDAGNEDQLPHKDVHDVDGKNSSDHAKESSHSEMLSLVSDSEELVEANVGTKMRNKKSKKDAKRQIKDIHTVKERRKTEDSPSKSDAEKTHQVSSVNEDSSRRMKEKSKKCGKRNTKDLSSPKKRRIEENKTGFGEEDVDQILSVDEDCSRGMKKWLIEYKESRPGLKILQQRIDDFITSYETQQEQEKEEREARVAEGGWTVVVHHKGRKKSTDAESGISVGSVAQAAVIDKMSKKKSKEVGLDFYRFQKRDAKRNEVMLLQSKFEQDKKRIQQLRAARKFRPY